MHQICIKNMKMRKQSDIYNLGIQMIYRIRDIHNLGFLHLDIKPSNIMVDKKKPEDVNNNINEIADFGEYTY